MAYNRRILTNLTGGTMLCIAATALVTGGICLSHPTAMVVGILFALLAVGHYIHRIRCLRESAGLLAEAIRNNDFSFRLPYRIGGGEQIMQESFNLFIQMMGKQKVQMEQREAFFARILSSVTTGIVVLDDEQCIVQTNHAALQLLGLTALTTLNQLEKYGTAFVQAFRTLAPGQRQHLNYSSSKGEVYLQLSASTIDLGEQSYRILSLNDIHHELSAKEQESWVKLTRVLTHEIMNSIAPISSLSETLMQRPDVRHSPIAGAIGAIHDTSTGLLNFVDSYRKYSSLQKPQPCPFSIRELFGQLSQLSLLPPQVRLTSQVEPADLMLYADPNLIRQVFINLLLNAVQAIGETEGRIHLCAFLTPEEQIFIHISNNGPVIPPEVAENIFVPFFTTKPHGNGIGLSLCSQIMKLSGGSISLLRPKTNGWNTTFALEFN